MTMKTTTMAITIPKIAAVDSPDGAGGLLSSGTAVGSGVVAIEVNKVVRVTVSV